MGAIFCTPHSDYVIKNNQISSNKMRNFPATILPVYRIKIYDKSITIDFEKKKKKFRIESI